MKVFITGINGFVGEHIVSYLLLKEFDIYGLDRSNKQFKNKHIKFFKGDILDKSGLYDIIRDIKPDIVFHLAGFSSVRQSFKEPELCKKINVEGTRNLLDSIMLTKINPKILVVSSAEVYGIPTLLPIKESNRLKPINPYGESKKEQEELCLKYFKEYKQNIIISRSFPHIGPGQQPIFIASDIAKQIAEIERKNVEPIIKIGDIEIKRDFTDVRDMVKAYLLAIQKCKSGEAYNLCSGNTYSVKDIVERLISFSKVKIKLEKDPSKFRPVDIPNLSGDNTKFIKQTGWKPEISMDKTLKDILDYWRNKID